MDLPRKSEPGFRVFVAASSLAAWPPCERKPGEDEVLVPWSFIENLRAGLDEVGLSWRKVKRESDAARRGVRGRG